MSEDRQRSFWVGLLVLGSFAILAILILLFGSLPSMFQSREYYIVRFNDAPGIGAGTPVRRSGVRVGEVDRVRLEEDGTVVVRLALTPSFKPRKYEKPTLFTGLIGGDATIDFVPEEPEAGMPPPDRTPWEPGDLIEGVRGANVNALLNRATEVVPTTQDTMQEIRKSIQRLEKSAPLIDNALREFSDLSKAVREAVPDTRRTIDEIRELARSVREAVPDVKVIGKDVAQITRDVRETIPEIREAVRSAQKVLQSIDEVVPEAKKLVQSVNEAVPDARALMKGINEGIPDVRQTAAEIAEFLKAVRAEIPELEKTNAEAREFIKSLREAIPDVRITLDEGRAFLKGARDTIPDVKQAIEEISATARRATRLGEQIGTLLEQNRDKINTGVDRVLKLFDDANGTVARVNNILSEENQRTVNEIIRSIRDTANKGPEIAREIDSLVRNFSTTVDEVRTTVKKATPAIDNLVATLNPLADTIQKILNPLVARAPTLAQNLDESVDKVNTILKDVRTIIRVFGESDGTLNRILTDPRLYNRVDEILCSVQKLAPRLELIVKDFGIFADKLARHPESIGIGGVVRPGDGMKNPPPVPGLMIRP